MNNPWLVHVAQYRAKNPNMPYKQVLINAKSSYTPVKKGGALKKPKKSKAKAEKVDKVEKAKVDKPKKAKVDKVDKADKPKKAKAKSKSKKIEGGNVFSDILKGVETVAKVASPFVPLLL